MNGFAFYYIEANLVCAIVFGILLLHNRLNIDRQEKQLKFDHALAAFILYFLTDCAWAAVTEELLPKTRTSMTIVIFLLYFFMSSIIYFWLDYVMAFEQASNRNRTRTRVAMALPFVLASVALLANIIIAPQMILDDALNTLPAYNVYLVCVPYVYMAAILFYTIRRAKTEENPAEKRNHLFVGFFPLMTIAGGLVEMLLMPEAPVFCFTAMILMLVFYIQSIERRVSLDPLTKLNNRGQLTRYCAQKSNLRMEGRLTVAMMMDIDGFKEINDTFGHAEGDRALVIVADALKKAVNRRNTPAFLGRYGGDEFILISHPVERGEMDELVGEIRAEIRQTSGDTPYTLAISAGHDALKDGEDTIARCIERADGNLYQDKKRRNVKMRTVV